MLENDAKNTEHSIFLSNRERLVKMQRMRSNSKTAIECGTVFSDIRLLLENYASEFHEMWHENNLLTGLLKTNKL